MNHNQMLYLKIFLVLFMKTAFSIMSFLELQ